MRIGMLTPSSNTVLEPVTAQMVAALKLDATVHFSRLRVTAISPQRQSRDQFTPAAMVSAASLLADAHVDVIVWNGTSGGWEGVERDREIVDAIEKETGIPATTGTLATIEALNALGVRRYGLVVPYIDEITAAIRSTFADSGLTCVAWTNEGVSVNWDFCLISPDLVATRCREVARAAPEAIVIFCTNLCGAPVVDQLEAELGMPILDSVAVCLWGAFHRLGQPVAVPGFGKILTRALTPDARLVTPPRRGRREI
jgi:maleate isomerase